MNRIHKLITRKRLLLAGAFGGAGLLISGIAYASIPGGDGVIHGCYKTSNPAKGSLIAIDSRASCPNGHAELNWNQTGPLWVSEVSRGRRANLGQSRSLLSKAASREDRLRRLTQEVLIKSRLNARRAQCRWLRTGSLIKTGTLAATVRCRRMLLGQLSATGRGQSFSRTPELLRSPLASIFSA